MIITRTPFRISLFGGGTDYAQWYEEHGGAVLSTTIDKYCYLSVRRLPPFFEHRYRIVYSRVELVNMINEIQHPVVRAVLGESGLSEGLEIHHDGDLPARSGLGSSSSFTVGIIHALRALSGQMVNKADLAKEAIHIEQDVLGEHVGCQDQVAAAHGGFNRIDFCEDGFLSVSPVILKADRMAGLQASLMLVFTGLTRHASEIAHETIKNIRLRTAQLHRIQAMVPEAMTILADSSDPTGDLGELMHESWCLKRELADVVSSSQVDEIYDTARSAGAIGGKLLGAGGGGFLLLVVRPQDRANVEAALSDLVHVSFAFDTEGSKVIVYDPD